jgi:hypothetical protein
MSPLTWLEEADVWFIDTLKGPPRACEGQSRLKGLFVS